MSPCDGTLAARRCPEEPQEGFLREVAELVLMDERESCEGSRWEECSGQRGPSHEEGEVGRLGGPSGRSRAEQSSWHAWSKVCEARRDEGGAGAQPRCQAGSMYQLRRPLAGEVAGRVGSEFDLEGSLWMSGKLKGQSHGWAVEGGVRPARPSLG